MCLKEKIRGCLWLLGLYYEYELVVLNCIVGEEIGLGVS